MIRSTIARSLVTVLVAVLSASCASSAAPTIDCSTTEVKPFSELKGAFSYCTSCHGGGRAPSGYRYDDYQSAVEGANAAESTIADGTMPPDSDMPEADANDIYAWVQCGTPE